MFTQIFILLSLLKNYTQAFSLKQNVFNLMSHNFYVFAFLLFLYFCSLISGEHLTHHKKKIKKQCTHKKKNLQSFVWKIYDVNYTQSVKKKPKTLKQIDKDLDPKRVSEWKSKLSSTYYLLIHFALQQLLAWIRSMHPDHVMNSLNARQPVFVYKWQLILYIYFFSFKHKRT